jgi:hypothetical protein
MTDYNRILKECYNKKCKNEVMLLSKIQKKRNDRIEELLNIYYNKKISKKEFIEETKKIENYYYNQKKNNKIIKMSIR